MERNIYGGNVKTVTTDSYLVCKYGGLIQPVSSGQEGGKGGGLFYTSGAAGE